MEAFKLTAALSGGMPNFCEVRSYLFFPGALSAIAHEVYEDTLDPIRN